MNADVAAPQKEPPMILVVDDFEDSRLIYADYLEMRGYRVVQAANGEEALHQLRESVPDVVVMDLALPVIDGWEVTRRIKADPATKHVVVIALSGHVDGAHAKQAREAGFDDFIAKPCMPDRLVAKITEHLAERASSVRVRAATP